MNLEDYQKNYYVKILYVNGGIPEQYQYNIYTSIDSYENGIEITSFYNNDELSKEEIIDILKYEKGYRNVNAVEFL